jgi:hypothetical protein
MCGKLGVRMRVRYDMVLPSDDEVSSRCCALASFDAEECLASAG